MSATEEPRRQNAVLAEDWQGEYLGSRTSVYNDISSVREQGHSTGVRVKGSLYPKSSPVTRTDEEARRREIGY